MTAAVRRTAFLIWLAACMLLVHAAAPARIPRPVYHPPVHTFDANPGFHGREDPADPVRTVPEWRRTPLEAAREAYRVEPGSFHLSTPFRDDLPYFKVRHSADAITRFALLREAHRKFGPALDAPFPLSTLTIIAADVSDNPDVQKTVREDLRKNIPARYRKLSAPLAALIRQGRQPTVSEIRTALRAHRDRTLIIVGHVDEGTGEFTLTTKAHALRLDLTAWSRLAHEERVNLIEIGCHSAAYSSLGAPAILNSAVVIRNLGHVIAAHPKTYADFYRHLTSEDLTLTFNVMDLALFYAPADMGTRRIIRVGIARWTSPLIPGGVFPATQAGPAVAACEKAAISEVALAACLDADRSRPQAHTAKAAAAERQPALPSRWPPLGLALLGGVLASLAYGYAWSRSAEDAATGTAPTADPASGVYPWSAGPSYFGQRVAGRWSLTRENPAGSMSVTAGDRSMSGSLSQLAPPGLLRHRVLRPGGAAAEKARRGQTERIDWPTGFLSCAIVVVPIQLIICGLLATQILGLFLAVSFAMVFLGVPLVFCLFVIAAVERSAIAAAIALGVMLQFGSLQAFAGVSEARGLQG
jgi:hypothetical protein